MLKSGKCRNRQSKIHFIFILPYERLPVPTFIEIYLGIWGFVFVFHYKQKLWLSTKLFHWDSFQNKRLKSLVYNSKYLQVMFKAFIRYAI
ncbi:CLUMA_CG021609, isoform A [Clunio marinus]|uniref:CLUMA_CG021609, isoform A n=1 Tax=Clunio marinus TaxID=568069 RepID=A0A1J1J7W5_9DIPT|nr:CLUMA_CG021609, isoform A [Clunio marinus]